MMQLSTISVPVGGKQVMHDIAQGTLGQFSPGLLPDEEWHWCIGALIEQLSEHVTMLPDCNLSSDHGVISWMISQSGFSQSQWSSLAPVTGLLLLKIRND